MSSLLTRRSRLPAVVSAALLFECLSGSYCPATYYSCQHVLAALPQIRVQPFQVHSFRQRHQPVAPVPTALSLYAAFLVAAGYVAIAACKAPVRAEAMPPLRLLPLPAAQYLLYRTTQIVVPQLGEHPAKVGECFFVRCQKRLLGCVVEGAMKPRPTVHAAHRKHLHFRFAPPQDPPPLQPIHLRLHA